MGWLKRSRGRNEKLPSEHPVQGLRVGMARASVIDQLGPPPKSITAEEYFASYKTVIGRPRLDHESWLYEDVPSSGQDIQIVISGGVLETVKVVDTREGRVIWSLG